MTAAFCEQHRDELRDSYRALVVRGDFEEVEAEYTKREGGLSYRTE